MCMATIELLKVKSTYGKYKCCGSGSGRFVCLWASVIRICHYLYICTYPDPDRHFLYGSRPRSFHHQAKKVVKTLISTVF
jgi:hypothetical protein